ncbi:MAG: hypothetical protein ACK4VY_09875 [Brevundimonas sp.]
MAGDDGQAVDVGDVFQERPAPHHRWRIIHQGLAFELVCLEEPHRFRFLAAAALTDPHRYTRVNAATAGRAPALPPTGEVR